MFYRLKIRTVEQHTKYFLPDADKAIQQIDFTGNLSEEVNANTTLFIIEEAKKTILNFSQGTVKVL